MDDNVLKCNKDIEPTYGGAVLISIVVPVYNAARTLEFTVGSIISPSFFDNCELILVDDGSTDGSGEVCDGFATIDGAIRVIHQENRGVSQARNAGIAAASGKYIMFVDSDDILPADCIPIFKEAINSGADLYIGGYTLLRRDGKRENVLPEETMRYSGIGIADFFVSNYSSTSFLRPVWGKAFRRELLVDNGVWFRAGVNYGEDILFLFNFLPLCHTIETISHSMYTYRITSASLSADRSSDTHILRVLTLLDPYSESILSLENSYPSLKSLDVYHREIVSWLICRVLTVFATRRTRLCTSDNISRLYHYMKHDAALNGLGGIFSLRKGQIVNIILFKIGCPPLSAAFYHISAAFCAAFNISPKRY